MQQFVDFFFTALKSVEEALYPSAIILRGLPRSIQLDRYSCGPKAVYSVLQFYKKSCTLWHLKKELGTTWEGTSKAAIRRVIRKYGLHTQTLRSSRLKALYRAIDAGHPVIVSLNEGWHYAVVYGYSRNRIFLMNPSLFELGMVRSSIPKDRFRKIWDNLGWAVLKTT